MKKLIELAFMAKITLQNFIEEMALKVGYVSINELRCRQIASYETGYVDGSFDTRRKIRTALLSLSNDCEASFDGKSIAEFVSKNALANAIESIDTRAQEGETW